VFLNQLHGHQWMEGNALVWQHEMELFNAKDFYFPFHLLFAICKLILSTKRYRKPSKI